MGSLVFQLILQKLQAFGRSWDGYKRGGSNVNKEKPWFQVKRHCKMLIMGDMACQITVGCDKYRIVRLAGKGGFRIVNNLDGKIIAEVRIIY